MKVTQGRIWEATAKDGTRPLLTYVKFDAEAQTLTATNGYIAVRVPCETEEGDESGMIPAAALKEAKKESLRIADGKATLAMGDGERVWNLGQGDLPDVDKILTDYGPVDVPYGVNPDLLGDLAAALGCGTKHHIPVALHPADPLRGMRVEHGAGDEKGVGVLMPVRLHSYKRPEPSQPVPDLANDAAVIAGVRAAAAALDRRRGRAKAAQAFRDAALAATEGASE